VLRIKMLDKIRIATRESALAMWQAHYVKAALETAHPGLEVSIMGMTTAGDRNKESPLSQMGGKGVFVKELEVALLENRADIAVHSMKDVPSVMPDGLELAAICEREDPRDALVTNLFDSLQAMPSGARIGSSSLRRRLQLQQFRPDLVYQELRGNVDTRLRKLDEGEYDGIILATAGLKRLGLAHRISESIDPEISLPSAGQGAVGIQCRSDADDVKVLLGAINHADSQFRVTCERMISAGLGASCSLPIAAFATLDNDQIHLDSYVSDIDGSTVLRVSRTGPRAKGIELAREVTAELIAGGALTLIQPHS
jgi:hydroxymethylbilane synthase